MIFFAEYGAIAHFLLENHRVFTKEAGVLIPAWRSGRAAYSTHTCFMNEFTEELISLFSCALIAVMFIAVAVGIFRQAHAPNIQRPLKWHIPVDHLDMLDIAMCGIIVLYFSLGALMAAATPPGASAPPTTTNMELDGYKIFNGTCLNLILAFVLLVRMFHTGRMEALGLKKHSLKALLYAPVAGYLLVLVIHFLLDRAGLFQWIEQVTHAPAEQSIVSVLRHSSDIPLVVVICFSAAIAAPLVEELIFRGYLYPIMKKYTGAWFALVTTSLLFGIIHVSLVPFIPLAIFGAMLVLLYEYTGSIWTPIIAHCIFNTATLINILYPGVLLPYGT